jgi:curved DNA-binding protein
MSAYDVKLTVHEARAILGLAFGAGPEDARAAFRAAAKQAHPDRPGGDAARFRQIVSAYRVLQTPALPAVAPRAAVEAVVEIGPLVALRGGKAMAVVPGRRPLPIRVPAGARHGERLRVGDVTARVRIVAQGDLQVRGSDLWLTTRAPANVLADGGRATVETPLGEKTLWVSRKAAERRLAKLEGEGLPARGPHPAGHLFVRLVPEAGTPEGPARARLRAFAAAWAA